MATIDKGFVVGDWCVPEDFNIWAKSKEPCEVVIEDGRYSMKIRYPNGDQEWTHPFRWNKCKGPASGGAPSGFTQGEINE